MVLISYHRGCWAGGHLGYLCFETINTRIILDLTGQILTVCECMNRNFDNQTFIAKERKFEREHWSMSYNMVRRSSVSSSLFRVCSSLVLACEAVCFRGLVDVIQDGGEFCLLVPPPCVFHLFVPLPCMLFHVSVDVVQDGEKEFHFLVLVPR